ncbi:MAG TPA: hypothetical protein VHV57_11000 [Acidimicrobiales bacterium]|jgi:hypothetical protein|nr:hypothetical protein [Acidimicrobiales bacterium]
MTIPDPTPIEPDPAPLDPDVPGGPTEPIDQRESALDEELDESFPSSDPSSTWAGNDE